MLVDLRSASNKDVVLGTLSPERGDGISPRLSGDFLDDVILARRCWNVPGAIEGRLGAKGAYEGNPKPAYLAAVANPMAEGPKKFGLAA